MELGVISFQSAPIYTRFKQLVAEAGHTATEVFEPGEVYSATIQADWQRTWTEAAAVIERADALFLPSDMALKDPQCVKQLHRRIGEGLRVLFTDAPDLKEQNDFLAFYGMRFTELVVPGSFATVRIPCSPNANGMFRGVDALNSTRPTLVLLDPPAVPLLAAPVATVIDATRDMRVAPPDGASAIVAVCHAGNGGAVLAFGGSVFFDTYVGATGVEFPGIDANMTLAKNVVDFLLKQERRAR